MRPRNIAKRIQTMVVKSKDGVKFPAVLGDAAGVVKADNYNNVYVIIAGSVFIAHNEVVPNISRLPVLVAKKSGKLEVVSARNAFHETPHINIPDHDHTWGKSNNPTWVRGEQFLPALITPNDDLSLHFKGWIYWIDGAFVPAYEQDIDFSSNVPSDGALIGLLEVDDIGAISILEGTPVASRELLTYVDIPTPSTGKIPLGFAVKLYAGQTKGLQGLDFSSSDLIDLRWSGYGSGGGGGGSLPTLDPARVVYTDPSTGDMKTSDELIFNETDDTLTTGDPDGSGDGDGSYLHGLGGDKTHAGVLSTFHQLVTYAGDNARASLVKLITSLGTKASPLAVTVGTLLGRLRFAGYDGDTRVADSATSADIKAVAADNFDETNHATDVVIATTPKGSTTMQDRFRVDSEGQVTLLDYGVGTFAGDIAKLLGVTSTGKVIEHKPSLLIPFGVYNTINPIAGNGLIPYHYGIDRVITYKMVTIKVYVDTTNNSSNYWTISLQQGGGGGAFAGGNVKVFSTANGSALTYLTFQATTFDLPAADVDNIFLRVVVNKVGSPGVIYVAGPSVEVEID